MARFSCSKVGNGRGATIHTKHARTGMFRVYGWRGMAPNAKNAPVRARFSCFVMVGGGELPKDKEHTLMGAFFVFGRKGWGWGGIGGARRGGDVSRHEKKRKNRQTYLVRPACCFPVPLRPPLVAPCVFRHVRRVFDASRPPRFVSCCSCRRSRLAVVSGPFRRSWGVVWRVLALTRRVGDGSGVGSGVG